MYVFLEARKEYQIPKTWSCKLFGATWHGYETLYYDPNHWPASPDPAMMAPSLKES